MLINTVRRSLSQSKLTKSRQYAAETNANRKREVPKYIKQNEVRKADVEDFLRLKSNSPVEAVRVKQVKERVTEQQTQEIAS